MSDADRFRERLAAAGVDLPGGVIDLVIATAGATVTALDELLAVVPSGVEPFVPARQLPDDAA